MVKRAEWISALERCLEGFIRDFPTDGEAVKEEYIEKVKSIINCAISATRKSAGCVNGDVNIILSILDKIENPTQEEVRSLADCLAGRYYLVDRKLSIMTGKAGLKATFRPEVGEALKYFKEIENKAVDFIKSYTSEKDLNNVMLEIKTIAEKL